MQFSSKSIVAALSLCGVTLLTSNCGIIPHKYDNPITNNSLQPDKQLFDRAMNDIEHGRYEVARLTLNTLINTYDSSEYLAKAKLAIADSWYREGGAHGLAEAEAEYKDFELFYPTMEESAEAQWRVCQIHYKQMEKVDRDNTQALRAEDECRQMITAYPNSHYTAQATQMLRNVQEVLAAKEFKTGDFYHNKGAFPAAENRLAFVSQQYPLYSHADDALWEQADSFKRMGDRFEGQEATALAKIVRDYPLSDHVDDAKKRLEELKKPIPAADPAAYARMKYEMEAQQKPNLLSRGMSILTRAPDTYEAAKTGAPAMQTLRPPTPVSVPVTATGTAPGGVGGTTDVTATTVSNTTELDTKPNVLPGASDGAAAGGAGAPGGADGKTAAATSGAASETPAAQPQAPPPTNHPVQAKKTKKQKKAEQKAAAATPPTPGGSPASTTGSNTTSTETPTTNPAPR
jgi:outer membrane protein assembly factor BamD